MEYKLKLKLNRTRGAEMSLSFDPNENIRVHGYAYRQVRVSGIFATMMAKENSEKIALENVHSLLAEKAGVGKDNHQSFRVGSGLWLSFNDYEIWIGSEAEIGYVGQF